MTRRILGLILVASCWSLVTSNSQLATPLAHAESSGLVVSPPFQQVTIAAGQTSQPVEITVTNRSAVAQTLTPQVVDFKSLDESGGVAFVGLNGGQLLKKYGLATWLSLPQTPIVLSAGASTKVTAVVQNRPDLAPGGHYGAVIFRVQGDGQSSGGTNLNVQQLFASLIFVDKTDGAYYNLSLASVAKPANWWTPNLTLGLRFANTGNVHAVPRGTVELTDSHGRVVERGVINVESGIILPGSDRVYKTPLRSLSAVTNGMYTLRVQYRYDGTDQLQTYTQKIHLVDWPLVSGLIALFVALLATTGFVVWRVYFRRLRRK